MYDGCSESNASYFIMLVHNVSSGCWWYDSREWTFPPISHCILLPCDRWQQRGSLTKWRVTWKCVWSKGVSWNFSPRKRLHLLTFIYACWTFTGTKQWMWGNELWVSAVVTVTWKTSHIPKGHADFYECSMQALVHCWRKCIANGGDYVEKLFIVAENLLYQIALLCSLYLLCFPW